MVRNVLRNRSTNAENRYRFKITVPTMIKKFFLRLLSIFIVIYPFINRPAHALADAESKTHGYDAATHRIVDTYRFDTFVVVQVDLPVLSHYSYILVSRDEALIVDPDRDIQFYLDYVSQNSLTIKGVYLTHSHADFVAGHLEIVKLVQCPIYQSASSGVNYPTQPIGDGSTFSIGAALVKVFATPAHTPDGTCALVCENEADRTGKVLFSGDTLFVGSVGRPDLLEGQVTAASLASMGFDTWQNKLSKLADSVLLLPAHGAGSLCGAHLSDNPSSTIGAERAGNPYLTLKNRNDYVTAILRELPEAPAYFRHNAATNRTGPPLVDWRASLPTEMKPDLTMMDVAQFMVVDIRDALAYAQEHISGSINIALRGRFETWVGTMVPWQMQVDGQFVIIGSPTELAEAIHRLHRIGYTAKVLSFASWRSAKLPTKKVELIEPTDLHARMNAGTAPIIVDVRLPSEWMGVRIGEVVNMPLNRLSEMAAKLDPREPVVTVCNSAYRSTLAIGILERQGFQQVTSLAGGSEAWINSRLPVIGAEATPSSAPATTAQREIRLADRLSAAELRRLIVDLPSTFDLVDIRPQSQFADYHIPNSRNVEIAELLANPAFLTGVGPLIVVDRDGSLAMQVAGILSQKSKRTIKALFGGLDAYWKTDRGTGTNDMIVPAGKQPAAPVAKPPPENQQRDVKPPPPPKKKPAGC